MTTPSFDNIFSEYYTLYRAEATVPTSTDDEYTIGIRLANEAVSRWSNYDATYWKELFTTAQTEQDGDLVVTTGITEYAAPENMKEGGGFIKILDSSGNSVRNYPILEPPEAQFRRDAAHFTYFTGDPANGFTLHINPTPDSSVIGMDIDYVYYKKPTEFESGSDVTECPNAEFIVHRMLANRLRASRNPYYPTALRDSEDMLKIMQMDNNSGSWANPWKLQDNSGTVWGLSNVSSGFGL